MGKFDEIFSDIYYDIKNPLAYSSQKNIYEASRKLDSSIRLADVKEWYMQQRINIHKPRKKKFIRPKTVIKGPMLQYQADLIDYSNLSKQNEGKKFILTMIDIFSKKAFAVSIKNKSGLLVSRVLDEIFEKEHPKYLQTDNGGEFYNFNVYAVLKKYKIKLFSTSNRTMKATIVERFNKTLRNKLSKYFTANRTSNYTKVLDDIVYGYNNTKHSSTNLKPAEVNGGPLQNVKIRQALYNDASRQFKGFKYKVGDFCRVSVEKSLFSKGSDPNFSEEVFRIIQTKQNGLVPTYQVEDLQKHMIKSFFVEDEIQVVVMPKEFMIKKIIDKKRQGGKTFYLVRWLGYEQDADSWIEEGQFV